MTINLPEHYTVAETANYLRRDRKTVENLIKGGFLFAVDATPHSKNRSWIITNDAIRAYLRGEFIGPAEIKSRKSVTPKRTVANNAFPVFSEMMFDGK